MPVRFPCARRPGQALVELAMALPLLLALATGIVDVGYLYHHQLLLTDAARDQLLDITRGRNVEVFDRAIDSQISRLRRKLNERTGSELIRTVRNEGYLLQAKVVRR